MSQALIGSCFIQGYGIKLAFVQVCHGPITLLLTQGPRSFKCVLKSVTTPAKQNIASNIETELQNKYLL